MGDTDLATKKYMANNNVFADAFNVFLRETGIVINPEELQELDPILIVEVPEGNGSMFWQRVRDLLKRAVVMSDGERVYLLLGIENQSDIHYAMPVRNALYDAMQYAIQVNRIGKDHREHDMGQEVTSAEFLSGFTKEDRLLPVITLVVYLNPEKWVGPKRLYDMIDVKDERILKYVADYKINLIEPGTMSDEEISLFKTDMKRVFLYAKYCDDDEKLKEVVSSDEGFKFLDSETAQVIKAISGDDDLSVKPNEKGKVDMCKALVDMKAKSKAEGKVEGKVEGRAEGRAEGRVEGKAEMILKFMDVLRIDVQEAMEKIDIPVSDRPMYTKLVTELKAKRHNP